MSKLMRKRTRLLSAFLLAASAAPAQIQSVDMNVSGGIRDERPFGKYLAEICTLSGAARTLSCLRTPLPAAPIEGNPPDVDATAQLTAQNISIKLDCDPTATAPCTLAY